MKKKPPRQIIGYLKDPSTWDAVAFETAIRNEVENTTGDLTASDEVLIGSLVIVMATMLDAHVNVLAHTPIQQYSSGTAPSAWYKIRTESLDKIIKVLAELALVARGRPKKNNKPTEIDELFAES